METKAQESALDKSDWGPGPWQDEPDYLQWRTQAGLPGLIVRNELGFLCGYAAVSPGHPDYEKHYDDVAVDVHGGLTYAEHCQGTICHVPEPGEPDDVWWFGFDCAHACDLMPGYRPMIARLSGQGKRFGGLMPFDVYRDLAYVQAEVEDLARQLQERGAACA